MYRPLSSNSSVCQRNAPDVQNDGETRGVPRPYLRAVTSTLLRYLRKKCERAIGLLGARVAKSMVMLRRQQLLKHCRQDRVAPVCKEKA